MNGDQIVFRPGLDTFRDQNDSSSINEQPTVPQCDQRTGDAKNQAGDFLDFAEQILSRSGPQTDRAASRISQTESLGGWIGNHCRLVTPDSIDSLPLVSNSTSEHEVFYRESDNRAVKRTWPGVYGQVPIPSNGRLERANATPAEYLFRQALHISVFGSDIRFEGVCVSNKPSLVLFEPTGQPSFVISQEWFGSGEAPEMGEIAESLRADGFVAVPNSYFGWYRQGDGVVIVDAKPDNFVKTPLGVVPIDLQMAVFSLEQVGLAGLPMP